MKNKMMPLAAAVLFTVAASNAMAADESGTLNFSGGIGASSCSVTGLDNNVSFKTMSIAEVEAVTAHGATLEEIDIPVSVTACPGSVTNGVLTVNYTSDTGNARAISLGNTTMRGASVGATVDGSRWLASGTTYSKALTSGAADWDVKVGFYRIKGNGSDSTAADVPVEGQFNGTVDLEMEYQ